MMKEIETFDLQPIIFDRLVARFRKCLFKEIKDTNELRSTKTWSFDWIEALHDGDHIFGLILETGELQGLISLRLLDNFVEVDLVESAPHNRGVNKRFELVGLNLFALAAIISMDAGFEGYISFYAKSNLVNYYKKRYLAKSISSTRMFIDENAAAILIKQCFNQEV